MNDNKKIAFNTIIVYSRLLVVGVVSLIISRIVLNVLGASDFGLYSVVGGIVSFLNVLNTSMMTTSNRFIAYEIGKVNGDSNKIFNELISIHILISLFLILLVETVGVFYVNHYLSVDPDKIDDALFVLHFSMLTAVATTISIPYQGLITAFERFSVTAIVEIIRWGLTLAGVVMLYVYKGNSLRMYAIIMFSASLIMLLSYYVYSLVKFKSIVSFKYIKIKNSNYKEIFIFNLWILLGAFVYIFNSQGTTVLINFFFGTIVNAAYAISMQVNQFLSLFANNLSIAAVPQITRNFSGGDLTRSKNLVIYISKYTYFLLLIPIIPLFWETDFFLNLWLKNVPEYTSVFCRLMMINILIGSLGAGLHPYIQASGKIKLFQIILNSILFLTIPITYIFYKTGHSPYYIYIVSCFINAIYVSVFIVLLRQVLGFDIKELINRSHIKMLKVTLIVGLLYFVYSSFEMSGVLRVLITLLSEVVLFLSIWFVGMEDRERKAITSRLVGFFK